VAWQADSSQATVRRAQRFLNEATIFIIELRYPGMGAEESLFPVWESEEFRCDE
jgi:hypothetical protein